MSEPRSRNYALITYHPEEVIKSVLTEYSSRIRHFAYIMHDKDTKEDGTPQVVHHHILLQFTNALSWSACRKLFPVGQNTLAEVMREKADCFRYLDHSDLPDKFHYEHSLIVSDDIEYWESLQGGEQDDKTLTLLDDIIAGISLRELARRYGRDLVINYFKYREFAKMLRATEAPVPKNLPQGMTVEEMKKSAVPCQNEMDDIIFDGPDGRVVIDKNSGALKEFF